MEDDRQREAFRALHSRSLDGAVIGRGLDDKTGCKLVDELAVQRIDHDPLAPNDRGKLAAASYIHRLTQAIAFVLALRRLRRPVLFAGRWVVGFALEGAAERHIELLKAAAGHE